MCGIAGYTGPKKNSTLKEMLDRLRHRGPDDEGSLENSSVQIGMTRLSIIDVEGGHQPISNEDGSIHVIFNGEIYNFVELREILEKKGHIFKTHSDTETLVHAYEVYGEELGHQLNGMFSLAIWDENKKSLFLMRDRYGVKPLFYAEVDGNLIFASEIKSILAYPGISREINPEALNHYFFLRYVPAPMTIYKNIYSLLPGHQLLWKDKKAEVKQWYTLPMKTIWKDSDEEKLTDQIDALLQDSIRLRMRSDVPVGAFLSGGIDSSTVVAIMSRFSKIPVETFSMDFSDSPLHKKDASFAKLVAERYKTNHHVFSMSAEILEKDWQKVVRQLDQPFSGVTSSYWLSGFMRKKVKVSLSGDGADDIFASYGHHRLEKNLADKEYGFFKDKKEFLEKVSKLSPSQRRLYYTAFPEEEKKDLFSKKGAELFGSFSASDFLKKIYDRSNPSEDALNRLLYLDIHSLLPNEILYYNDFLSMAHGLEVRTPFLDYRLVELACQIPGSLKIKNLTLKYILRKVASRYLPQEIIERPKEGFVLPNNTWLRGPLSAKLREILSEKRLAQHGYLNGEYVRKLLDHFFTGDEQLTFRLWTLANFQLWFEEHLK